MLADYLLGPLPAGNQVCSLFLTQVLQGRELHVDPKLCTERTVSMVIKERRARYMCVK